MALRQALTLYALVIPVAAQPLVPEELPEQVSRPIVWVSGQVLKPEPKRDAWMYVHENFIKIGGSLGRDSSDIRIERSEIAGMQYETGTRRASAGTMVAFGLFGAIAGKRTMTTLGIEKKDGGIIIFRWKGKDTMHVTMALDQFMAKVDAESDAQQLPEADGGCTVEQIAAMARAGLPDDKIKAACGDRPGTG